MQSLLASIAETGVMKDPIHTRKKKDGSLHLIAGGHRLETARRRGTEWIDAWVWTGVTDDWARLMEIDDNLAGAEMNALDTAVFLATRKEVYERIHPQAKAATGAALAAKRWSAADTMSVASFAASTAEKFGMTDRHVRRLIEAGAKLGPDEVAKLRAAPRAVTLKDLTEIAKIGPAPERYDVVARLAEGRAKSAADARRALRLEREGEAPVQDPADQQFLALQAAWNRAGAKARTKFVDANGTRLIEMLGLQLGVEMPARQEAAE
ncbi:ParB N-terminal domain-containing protein [Rhodobacter capsulatus]